MTRKQLCTIHNPPKLYTSDWQGASTRSLVACNPLHIAPVLEERPANARHARLDVGVGRGLVLLVGAERELFGVAAVGRGQGLVPRREDKRARVGHSVLGGNSWLAYLGRRITSATNCGDFVELALDGHAELVQV